MGKIRKHFIPLIFICMMVFFAVYLFHKYNLPIDFNDTSEIIVINGCTGDHITISDPNTINHLTTSLNNCTFTFRRKNSNVKNGWFS